ncbi:nucleoside hydrolase-like domain-containing protein [Pseudomonadota bacterium]
MKPFVTFFIVASLLGSSLLSAADTQAHRLLVLTDMGADPDDEQSLVRLLLYANQIEIEGIVATTSVWQKNRIRPDFIATILNSYEKVQSNLLLHEPGYPTAEALRSLVKHGLPRYGMLGVGEGMDSAGSDWIIELLEKEDDRPLWISVWGGANTLAQALYRIDKTKSAEDASRLISRLRVYTISDQDDSAAWMRKTFPDLFYIVSPGDDYGQATWIAINNIYEGIDNDTVSNEWLANNIQQGHGPLGAAYPDVAWGMEGDTPAFLSLIPNGLNHAERPDWGGWGGRYELRIPDFATVKEGDSDVVAEPETRPIWTNASDNYVPYVPGKYKRAVTRSDEVFTGNHVTLWRWRDDFQNDFAARMDWCTLSYEEANHPPIPHLNHPEEIAVKSGQGFTLDAYGSSDPDGDSISYLWFHYPEAGTYREAISVEGAENADRANFTAPNVDEEVTAHFILKLTDKGSPSLSRYKRVIVTIEP